MAGWALFLAVLLPLLPAPSAGAAQTPAPSAAPGVSWVEDVADSWRYRVGDDPDWTTPGYDDSAWPVTDLVAGHPGLLREGREAGMGTVWFRREVRVPSGVPRDRLALALVLPREDFYQGAAYELYVDGVPVGGAGGPDERLTSPHGRLHPVPPDSAAPVDPYLDLALRVWPAPGASPAGWQAFGGAWIGDRDLLAARLAQRHHERLLAGADQLVLVCLFLVVGLYHLFLFLQRRSEIAPLWLTLLATAVAGHAFLGSPWVWELTDRAGPVLIATAVTVHLVMALLYQYLWTFFDRSPGPWLRGYQLSHVGLALAAPVVGPAWILASQSWRWAWILLGLVPIAALVVGLVRQRHRDAVTVGIGAAGLLAVTLPLALGRLLAWDFLPKASWGFAVFVLFLSIAAARRLGRARWELDRLNRDLEAEVSESTAALVAAEMRYRTLVELNPVPVFLSGRDGEVTDCNRAFLEVFGLMDRRQALGLSGEALFADPGERRALMQRHRRGEPVSGVEVELRRLDGSRFWALFSEAPVVDPDGPETGGGGEVEYEATVVDDSVRRAERRRLEESERRYRQLIENSPGLICSHDLDGRLLAINPAACRLLGYGADEVEGRELRDFVDREVVGQVDTYLREMVRTGDTSGLLRVRTRSGESRLILFRATTLRREEAVDGDLDGEAAGGGADGSDPAFVLGFGQDVTELKEAERELRTSFDSMRDLNRIAATPGLSFRERVSSLLDLGRDRFGLTSGCFCRLRGGRAEVVAARPADGLFTPGQEVPADGPLCRPLTEGTVAVERLGGDAGAANPDALEALLGAPVLAGGRSAGSLVFFSRRPRSRAFDAAEIEFLKLMALWVGAQLEQEQRAADAGRLAEMSELLQSCGSLDEAHQVVVRLAAQFFPEYGGGLLLSRRGEGNLTLAARWGEGAVVEVPTGEGDGEGDADASAAIFETGDCWAARRGREHVVEDVSNALVCRHVAAPPPASYLCMPMVAMGELVGVLHLWPLDPEVRPGRSDRRLAASVAEHAALALVNLELREDLRRQSIHDALTGLHNRRFFDRRLEEEWRRAMRSGAAISLLLLDLDGFKAFNDTYGHQAGDLCLRRVAEALQGRVQRSGDVIARYGGEELTVILPDTEVAQAAYLAEAVRTDIESLGIRDANSPFGVVTISIGVAARIPGGDDEAGSLVSAADRALYDAKAAGRNQVVSHSA